MLLSTWDRSEGPKTVTAEAGAMHFDCCEESNCVNAPECHISIPK